jgi:hypothetical protein
MWRLCHFRYSNLAVSDVLNATTIRASVLKNKSSNACRNFGKHVYCLYSMIIETNSIGAFIFTLIYILFAFVTSLSDVSVV